MSSSSRASLELPAIEISQNVRTAQTLKQRLENSDIQLVKKPVQLNAHRMDSEDEEDPDERKETKDPAIVAMEVADQITYLRKLKFQYLEQNAKDKYVKSIVSDIDDAPIVTAEQNNELALVNEAKKEKLKEAKERLAEVQNNIRLLAPMVEQDYQQVKLATERANLLSEKILAARTQLLLLRQTHPHPRLTIPLADQKLADQVTEMQSLSDQVQSAKSRSRTIKTHLKTSTSELETLRLEAAEAEKQVAKSSEMEEDDNRLVPLYNWYTASLALHRSVTNLEESHSESENELRLTYRIDPPSSAGTNVPPHRVSISLIFAPDTKKLAGATVDGFDELGLEPGDVVDSHVQVNDVHGLVAALLARARAAINT
ncbi:hypothetical protein D9613_011646 [Agrocybe pediades]|uniref:Kinetochore protein Sos7 coiled-coil domain-containing protein n=1 Tax=Agrocybe pediades TaxID=84607 RepID=A0A8H4QVH9_9AGAR|nr:hypothetical protein D9613_011646 [Agrocybe pediades]